MEESILNSVKKVLGIEPEYDAFDLDVMMHVNSVFTTLAQLGIGPVNGFMIEDAEPKWTDFLGEDLNLNSVKTYVYLRVRLAFDPPATSFHIAAIEKQIDEIAWRLNVHREATQWASPINPPIHDDGLDTPVIDGGVVH